MIGQVLARGAAPLGKTRYPLRWKLCGPQGTFGRERNIFPTLGFDRRTVHSQSRRYPGSVYVAGTHIELRTSLSEDLLPLNRLKPARYQNNIGHSLQLTPTG